MKMAIKIEDKVGSKGWTPRDLKNHMEEFGLDPECSGEPWGQEALGRPGEIYTLERSYCCMEGELHAGEMEPGQVADRGCCINEGQTQ